MRTTFRLSFLLWPVLALGQGSQLPKYTVATLPSAASYPSYTVQVIDGSTQGDCTIGSGTYNVLCTAHAGSWIPVASGSISGQASGVIPLATSASTIGAQSHLNENTPGVTIDTQEFEANSSTSNVPAIFGVNTGTSTNSIDPGWFFCPNAPTGSISGCGIVVGLAGTDSNGLVATLGFLNGGSAAANQGFLGMGTQSGTATKHAFRWDYLGNSFFPQLSSVGCLGTDSSGKLGPGAGCSGSIPNTNQILAGNGSGAAVATHMDDGHTNAGTITSTEPIQVNDGTGFAGAFKPSVGTDPGGTAGTATYTTDTTNGYAEVREGTAALSRVCTAANGVCVTSGSQTSSVTYSVATGVIATPAGPYILAPTNGTVSHCYFTTQTSDGATALTFNVKFNGVNIISGTNATVAAGTVAGTISTFTLTSGTIAITQGQKWEFDISSGTANWTGAMQCF